MGSLFKKATLLWLEGVMEEVQPLSIEKSNDAP